MGARRTDTQEARDFWAFVERTAEKVAKWPAWKRGETNEREAMALQSSGQFPQLNTKPTKKTGKKPGKGRGR